MITLKTATTSHNLKHQKIYFKKELKSVRGFYGRTIGILYYDWPEAQNVLNNVFEHIGGELHLSKRSIAVSIATAGLNAYERALQKNEMREFNDHARMCIFVQALLNESCRLAKSEIVDQSTDSRWNIASIESFGSWKKSKTHKLSVEPWFINEHEAVRQHLLNIYLTPNLKALFKEYNYENPVVANRFCVPA